MSRKGVCRFNEQWLRDDTFKTWLKKDKSSVTTAGCKHCSISFDLSNMEIGAVVTGNAAPWLSGGTES